MSQTVRIEKMVYAGDGATSTGITIPFVLPDELVQVSPTRELTIVEPSPDRITPKCIHFGSCGGCHYQQATYPAQLRIKQTILADIFTAADLTDLPPVETHAADPWHYRNRIRLRVGEVEGELRIGYNRYGATGGDSMLPVTMCPIAAPILWQAASTLLGLARTEATVRIWLAAAIELELFTNHNESALQLTLYTRAAPLTSFASFCAKVQAVIPQLTGAGVALLPKKPSLQGRRSEHVNPGPQWGSSGLVYEVGLDKHWVSRGGFFQANRHLVAELTRITTADRFGTLAWDLYAGVGLFSRALARTFAEVIAVEAGQPAATDLAAALRSSGKLQSTRALAMTTLDFLQVAVVQRERPDVVVMDPPRAGVGLEICSLLARAHVPELIYVSCDPVTLARDLKPLTASGYKISELHLVDMFPQTFHMETVAILHR